MRFLHAFIEILRKEVREAEKANRIKKEQQRKQPEHGDMTH